MEIPICICPAAQVRFRQVDTTGSISCTRCTYRSCTDWLNWNDWFRLFIGLYLTIAIRKKTDANLDTRKWNLMDASFYRRSLEILIKIKR